jgi:Holliday junction resolvasome RuvABC endonuclease subunit
VIVLGLDTGLANLGWALVDIGPMPIVNGVTVEVIDAGVWTTAKETKKRQLHVGSDDARRIDYLADRIFETVAPPSAALEPRLVVYELPAAAKGARAAHALGIGHALIRTALRAHTVTPVVEVTARDVKLALAGDAHASKEAMIAAARVRWPGIDELRNGDLEHAADAIGVAITGAGTQVGRAVLARGGRP